jgi:2-polyprenyl-3-methyl-5-hydroxy-6-metoxy-1,4-benzoquinol methylase
VLLGRVQELSRELGRPLRLVDLASGAGVLTCAVSQLGHRALGIDADAESVHWAKLFAQEQKCDALFWRADLIQDPFWEQTVAETLGGRPDVILLTDALEFLPQSEFFLDRLSRWLEPGTRLIVSEPNPRALLSRRTGKDYETWRQLLEARGFVVDRPAGIDRFRWLERLAPGRCSSLVFNARRR